MKHVLHMLSLGQVQYPLREWVRSPLPSPTSGKGELQTQNPEPASGHHYPTIVGPPLRPSVSPPTQGGIDGPALQAGRRPGQGGTCGTLFCPHSLGCSEPACHEGLEGPSGEAIWGLLTVVSRT